MRAFRVIRIFGRIGSLRDIITALTTAIIPVRRASRWPQTPPRPTGCDGRAGRAGPQRLPHHAHRGVHLCAPPLPEAGSDSDGVSRAPQHAEQLGRGRCSRSVRVGCFQPRAAAATKSTLITCL